jgi:hypothetical protein
MSMTTKRRCMFMIEPDQLDQLRSLQGTSGLTVPDQIRLGIQCWLASREWPVRKRGARATSRAGRARPQAEEMTKSQL